MQSKDLPFERRAGRQLRAVVFQMELAMPNLWERLTADERAST